MKNSSDYKKAKQDFKEKFIEKVSDITSSPISPSKKIKELSDYKNEIEKSEHDVNKDITSFFEGLYNAINETVKRIDEFSSK